jgi:hypothetical protein
MPHVRIVSEWQRGTRGKVSQDRRRSDLPDWASASKDQAYKSPLGRVARRFGLDLQNVPGLERAEGPFGFRSIRRNRAHWPSIESDRSDPGAPREAEHGRLDALPRGPVERPNEPNPAGGQGIGASGQRQRRRSRMGRIGPPELPATPEADLVRRRQGRPPPAAIMSRARESRMLRAAGALLWPCSRGAIIVGASSRERGRPSRGQGLARPSPSRRDRVLPGRAIAGRRGPTACRRRAGSDRRAVQPPPSPTAYRRVGPV